METEEPSPIILGIHHVAIQTAYFDKAFSFYTGTLGMEVIKEPFVFKGKRTMAWLRVGDGVIELYSVKKNEIPQKYDSRAVGPDHIALEVSNLEATLAFVGKRGVKVLKAPFRPLGNMSNQPLIAFIEGPDGEEIEIRERID